MGSKLYVLDTNVLMHDPMSLFAFGEHDLFIPMKVLEELDQHKKGLSDVARNARQVSRFLDQIIHDNQDSEIQQGLFIHTPGWDLKQPEVTQGRLFFQTEAAAENHLKLIDSTVADNEILRLCLHLQQVNTHTRVVLVSKDINLRIKAAILHIEAKDYRDQSNPDDLAVLHTGMQELPANQKLTEIPGKTQAWLLHTEKFADYYSNLFLYDPATANEFRVVSTHPGKVMIHAAKNYELETNTIWGVQARNRAQNFAFNLLMDPSVELVTLLGSAGTGKTLLSLAAGLAQTMEENRYREIIMTRATIPLAEDIGFLPGTEEEKMTPWMGALMDNLEVLISPSDKGYWAQQATHDLVLKRIKIRSVNFMRGRTFLDRYVIIDEAQNLTPKQMKALITRAGPGSKFVCIGNLNQIDTPYLNEFSSGLTYVVRGFQAWPGAGHITLQQGERSPLAAYASENL